ncbi:hypothetical protein [Tenacibaculum litopenaei]|uniref:hypothetical protein n=1 Tax=Tenacibaculum litopenaei TaxID=396016 RepID=UPI0038B6653B
MLNVKVARIATLLVATLPIDLTLNGNLKKILHWKTKKKSTIVLDVLKGSKIWGTEHLKYLK